MLPEGFSYTDSDGNKRHRYIKIAKDQGQRMFATIFESLMAKWWGEKVDPEQIVASVQDALPYIPTQSMPPTFDAIFGYAANKDFWRMEDIWKGREVLPKAEYTKYTHPAFKELGELTGLSPERTKYALQQYFTYNNIYTSMGAVAWKQIFKNLPERQQELVREQMIERQPFMRRMLKSTNPYYEHGKPIEDLRLKEATEKHEKTVKFDDMVDKWLNKKLDKKDILKFVSEQNKHEQDRLIKRLKTSIRFKNLPERRWWIDLADLSPEARAYVFWARWQNKKDREMLMKNLKKAPGIDSERFRKTLKILMAKSKQKGEKK
jgi:hypothetical protein